MSKMKHILRKLHIGGGIHDHHRLAETRPVSNPNASSSASSSSASSSSNGRTVAVETTPVDLTAGDGGAATGVDFNFLEEEFQVQLALAISASDPDSREDPESAQIDAAKRISLGCPVAPVTVADIPVQSLSMRYWSYNFVNYNEKVVDGFYDVHCINSSSVVQGKMPLLVDLQALSVSDNINYEVILVNRFVDPELRELEKKAYAMMSLEDHASDGLILNGLIQRIADIVVDKMGGPVGDADEMSKRWTKRSCELRNALNTVIIPLGCLDIGLSRHRALLFKVLADRINLPCMLVKGSYYTGTDDGAVNLIKIDKGREYIVDLMGAPGTLIPTEVPSSHLLNTGFEIRGLVGPAETARGSSLVLGEGPGALAVSSRLERVPLEVSSVGIKTNDVDNNVEKNKAEMLEHEFGKLSSCETSTDNGKLLAAQNIKVNDVSKYVITAAKNPEFAQKLHAVLLESGASPPPDLFSDINPQALIEQKVIEQVFPTNRCYNPDDLLSMPGLSLVSVAGQDAPSNFRCDDVQEKYAGSHLKGVGTNVLKSEVSFPSDATSEGFALNYQVNEKLTVVPTYLDAVPLSQPGLLRAQVHESSLQPAVSTCHSHPQHDNNDNKSCFQDKVEMGSSVEGSIESSINWFEMASNTMQNNDYNDRIDPVLGEVAEWEIPWEDLQIGERIGIGSYGEVYHADWNGTEVAVKKFLDQDLSGDALVQFKCEAEIMLRLRHPNVVLFMGAVTRPPHLSILTEFLPRGSLYKLLHRANPLLDEKRRMKMALDVAKGMNYLHTSHPTIVHRDLKSPNLLVDKNWVVKVSDFGLSRMKHHTFLSSKSTAGTPEWMAPEILRNEPANEKCDVFSFGVILWELSTCEIPWKGMNPMQVVGAVGFQNRRLEIPRHIDPAIGQIIRECWQREPHLRPSFAQIISRLRRIQRLLVERAKQTNQTAATGKVLM